MGTALVWLVNTVIGLMVWFIIIQAILSWLFAFDVINHRNRFVNQLASALDSLVTPVLAPIRSVIPPLGGIDITPIVMLIIIHGVRVYLLPASQAALLTLFGAY